MQRDGRRFPRAEQPRLFIRRKKITLVETYKIIGAGNETRTRDPNLGKVVLYQLSYSRNGVP